MGVGSSLPLESMISQNKRIYSIVTFFSPNFIRFFEGRVGQRFGTTRPQAAIRKGGLWRVSLRRGEGLSQGFIKKRKKR